jgi:hypothetical protein
MPEDLLDDIDDKIAQLGKPVAEFSVRGRVLFRNLVIAPVLLAAGTVIEVGLFWAQAFHNHHIVLIGAFLMLMGVMLVVRALRNRGLRVLVFPEGLVRIRRTEGRALLWEEVHQVWRKKIDGHWARAWQGALILKIQRKDGGRIEFDDSLPRLQKLSEILHRETLPYLLPAAVNAFESGRSLDFGKLRLDQAGLKQGNEAIRWTEVQEIKFGEDQVTIYKKGKWGRWCQAPVADIPNAHVLRALFAQLAPVKNSHPEISAK